MEIQTESLISKTQLNFNWKESIQTLTKLIFFAGLYFWERQWRKAVFCCSYWPTFQWGHSVFNFESWPQSGCCWAGQHKFGNLKIHVWSTGNHTLGKKGCKLYHVCGSRACYCGKTLVTEFLWSSYGMERGWSIVIIAEACKTRNNNYLHFVGSKKASKSVT